MKAVIYESNTGHAERYAKALADMLHVPCYDLKNATKSVSKGENVIFIGWVFANQIMGYKKAAKRWNITAVGAVGLFPDVKSNNDNLIAKNRLTPTKRKQQSFSRGTRISSARTISPPSPLSGCRRSKAVIYILFFI